MAKSIAHRDVLPSHPTPIQQAQSYLFSPLGSIALCCVGLVAIAIYEARFKPKGQLARAYWGGRTEKKNAQKKGKAQLASPKIDSTALYINTPKSVRRQHREWMISEISTTLSKRGFDDEEVAQRVKEFEQSLPAKVNPLSLDRTIYFPDVQQGTAVFGAAGTGKSYGVLNPFIRAAIDREFSVLVWDFKYPEQTKEIAGYAKEHGYNIRVIAPSFPESSVFNILDTITDSGHSVAAGQIAKTIIKNLSSGDKKAGNEFFENAGSVLVQGVLLAAKWIAEIERRPELADLMMASSILSLPNLSARLKFATKRLNVWNAQTFAQLVAAAGGGETNVTEGGIIATAHKVFQQFVQRDFVTALCGDSNCPPEIEGKTLVIVGMNQDYREVLSPILATILDTLISYNIAHTRHRTKSLLVSLDELPAIYLPKIANWLAEARSAGFIGLIGLQNQSQLKEAYGENRARTILGNCATKFFLNPQDDSSAEQYSKYLGEKDIKYWTKSISTGGGKNGRSVSRSEHIAKVPLMEAAEFNKLPQGKAVTISPGYSNNQEAYVPVLRNIEIQSADIASSKRSIEIWEQMVPKMSVEPASDEEISQWLEERRAIAERLLPEPPADDTYTLSLASLIDIAVDLGYAAPDPNSYINDDVAIYQRWMTKSKEPQVDLPKIQRNLELLLILLASHGISLNRQSQVPTNTQPEIHA